MDKICEVSNRHSLDGSRRFVALKKYQEEANKAREIEAAHWDNVGCCFSFVEEWAAVARFQLEEARDKLKEARALIDKS